MEARIVQGSEKRCFARMMDMLQRNGTALMVVLALPLLAACDRIASYFLSNTERGQLELTVERAVNTSKENVTETRTNEQLRYMKPVLARTLPPGVEIYVNAAASEYGMYRYGSGWINSGQLHLGQYGVMAETVEVVSSDINVLTAEVVPKPTDHRRRSAKLITLKPGSARLTFKTSKLDKKMQRVGDLIEDSIVVTVTEHPGVQGSPEK